MNFFRVAGVEKPGGAGRGELYLVDLPGYGYASAPRDVREQFERIAVSYLAGREPLRLCVFIVDARHEPSERDETLRAWLEHERPAVRDRGEQGGRARPRRGDAGGAAIARGARTRARTRSLGVSAERGTGLDELWNVIRGAAFAPRATSTASRARPPSGEHHGAERRYEPSDAERPAAAPRTAASETSHAADDATSAEPSRDAAGPGSAAPAADSPSPGSRR